jgi:hypothetical protein
MSLNLLRKLGELCVRHFLNFNTVRVSDMTVVQVSSWVVPSASITRRRSGEIRLYAISEILAITRFECLLYHYFIAVHPRRTQEEVIDPRDLGPWHV